MSSVILAKHKTFKIFVISDQKVLNFKLTQFLNDYENYELHFIPTGLDLFDVINYEPDVLVMDQEVNNVVKCYEWAAA